MREKLKLNVDQLLVDRFQTSTEERDERGTVHGRGASVDWCDTRYDATCRGYGTCGIYPCRPVP